jgi:hypothetical protein
LVGSGWDWQFTVGLPDTETLTIIRALQRKISKFRNEVIGRDFETLSDDVD